MKIKGWMVALQIGFSLSLACSGQTPPNDNLSNSIVLTGTDITFTGNLAGATLEDTAETYAWSNLLVLPETRNSIWWSWTAPTSTVLNLEIHATPPYSGDGDGVAVYQATNGTTSPAGLLQPPVGLLHYVYGVITQVLSVPVSAGTNYRIQLIGSGSNNYTFRLVATNAPLVLKQPLSQTVYSNASAMFYVESAGLMPRTYQWFLNGTNLPGETTPILGLNNINASMTGSYSILVSNATGSVLSDGATLAISQTIVAPSLSLRGSSSNLLAFTLTGEIGRTYQIESSTDLKSWSPEPSFPVIPPPVWFYPYGTSIVFDTNTSLVLTVTNNTSRKFYRASIYLSTTPHAEICINNLRQILIAKLLWQTDTDQNPIATPTENNIFTYFSHPLTIFCPDDQSETFDTSYNIASLQVYPTCLIIPTNHLLQGVP